MNSTEIVQTFITALQWGDMEEAVEWMADDFVLSGWTPRPLNRGEFLAMHSTLKDAMPDYSFHLNDVQERDGGVEALIQITGTQMRDLALPMFGVPLIRYTGIDVVLPQVRTTFSLEGDKIKEMRVESVPGGGLAGLLQQIGTELPVLPRLDDSDIRRMNESGET